MATRNRSPTIRCTSNTRLRNSVAPSVIAVRAAPRPPPTPTATCRTGTTPMLPLKYIQASCGKCHQAADNPGAPELARGQQVFEDSGCRGCHKLGGVGGVNRTGTRQGRRSPFTGMAQETFPCAGRRSHLDPRCRHKNSPSRTSMRSPSSCSARSARRRPATTPR